MLNWLFSFEFFFLGRLLQTTWTYLHMLIILFLLPGYSRQGSRLPLHSNFELTNTGIILEWDGDGVTSRHDVIFSVTDSKKQTKECLLTIVLQGKLYSDCYIVYFSSAYRTYTAKSAWSCAYNVCTMPSFYFKNNLNMKFLFIYWQCDIMFLSV